MELALFCELFVIGVIFLGGIICNVLVIYGICRIKAKKTSGLCRNQHECINILIINLAIADLVMILVSMPTDMATAYVSWPFGEFGCKFISPIQDICLTTSILTFAVIAVERYLVSKGMSPQSERRSKLVALGSWLAALITVGIPMMNYKTVITIGSRKRCIIVWPNIYVARFFIFYVVAMVLTCIITGTVAYCSVRCRLARVHKINTREKSEGNNDGESDDSFAEQTLKVSKMIFVLITVFIICVLPFTVYIVLDELHVLSGYKYTLVIYLCFLCFLFANSLANPIIVLLMRKECRTALSGGCKIFSRKWIKSRERIVSGEV